MIPSHIDVFLASNSPRRHELLSALGIVFQVISHRADEHWPTDLSPEQVAEHIAQAKADSLRDTLSTNQLLIASDTVVSIDGEILGKPESEKDAQHMLRQLSGRSHSVYTAVSMLLNGKTKSFTEETIVHMNSMSEEEIQGYVRIAEPFDKAGGYAIQEWVGLAKIERIEGSYANVVGLPTARLYRELTGFTNI